MQITLRHATTVDETLRDSNSLNIKEHLEKTQHSEYEVLTSFHKERLKNEWNPICKPFLSIGSIFRQINSIQLTHTRNLQDLSEKVSTLTDIAPAMGLYTESLSIKKAYRRLEAPLSLNLSKGSMPELLPASEDELEQTTLSVDALGPSQEICANAISRADLELRQDCALGIAVTAIGSIAGAIILSKLLRK
jgi:hypothetical protein